MTDPQPSPPAGDNSQQSAGNTRQGATGQDYAKLQEELTAAQAKLDEMMNISKHALADLQNYKRRVEEEQAAFVTFANTELVSCLLPALSNFDRALKHEPKDAEWTKGIEQTYRQLIGELEKRGLKSIPAQGQKFDPHFHEALLTAPGEKDMVLEELEKGWMLGDRVIKPARVKVGNGENAASPAIPTPPPAK